MKKVLVLCSIALLGIVPLASAAPSITHSPLSCVPAGGNAKIVASAEGVASARVYFKSNGGPEYYVEMLQGPDGFWAVLPKPEQQTTAVTYRIVARDADGSESATSSMVAPVSSTCASFNLSGEERQIASNLVVGQTVAQVSKLHGWRCEGVTNTITAAGEMKSYDECNDPVVVLPATASSAAGRNAAMIVSGAIATGIGVVAVDSSQNDDSESISPVLP